MPLYRHFLIYLNKEWVYQYAIAAIAVIATFFFNIFDGTPHSLFLFLLTTDGIHSTIAFLRLHANNLTQSQILEKINTIYEIDVIDRYIYYLCVTGFYTYISLLFWIDLAYTYIFGI